MLLLVAMTLLLILTLRHESGRAQEQVERLATEAAEQVRASLLGAQQSLQSLALPTNAAPERWRAEADALLRRDGHALRIERRRADWQLVDAVDSPYGPPLFSQIVRADIDFDTATACRAALRLSRPTFSASYFVPRRDATGLEVLDLCLPVRTEGRDDGFLIATFSLPALLADALAADQIRHHELSFVEGDGARLARAGSSRGRGVYRADSLVELPGSTLRLRLDSQAGPPSLIPNVATALVLGLTATLFGLLLLLARDAGRRARAEAALAEALAFRKAMEDSLLTGLRARDLQGRITYVNPAFCAMVGFSAEALREAPQPPYWPPELVPVYEQRQAAQRQASDNASREGVETLFMRRNGERFPVMIYEAPLVDGQGRHTGWMSAVVDISAQRRAEELSRQQQERLQATARLATIGEMASLLSHELNQPLAAIASYATGSLNLMEQPDDATPAMVHEALQRIAQQAERAGRVIKSVHDFVRRREQLREALGVEQLIEAVLPLVRLQARKSGTQIDADLPQPAPRVLCDRTMVEQVLLNLARNAIQAMEQNADPASRVLRIRVRQTHERWVTFYVADTGPGIDRELGARLFTPFFTTRREGMGLGLSLCRTVVEQHGGAMDFDSPVPGTRHGTEFRFTLPSARPRTEAGADESAEPQTLTP